ncbi:MAG: hypothetical protein M0Z61_03320 [Nitrospiraceae bacterium]|nr:hypothetical protein [Nitrospiraceae bacterium]
MKNLSLKLRDDIFEETERIIAKAHKTRNAYINDALDFYNKINERKLLKEKLKKESRLVSKSSMEVLEEFEFMEDNLPD